MSRPSLTSSRKPRRTWSSPPKIAKLGVYGRAETSSLTGQPMLAARGGFIDAARQTLTKLGVQWELTEFQRAYNEGRSTQVPLNPAVRVRGRFARRLRYQGMELRLER